MGEITHELSMSLFRDNKQTLDIDFARLAEGLYARLQAWFEGIPDCLSSVDATPHVMSLQFVPPPSVVSIVPNLLVPAQFKLSHHCPNNIRVPERVADE